MKRIIISLILTIMFVPFIVNAETLSVTDCNNNKLNTTVPSKLKGLAKIMAENAYLDNGKSEYVTSCEGVKFNETSSDTNGKGVYEIASTKNDTYPIYYYRGAVDNNNVKFGGFCWKAIRTTDTGGVKLIYNGEPDESGNCTNTTGESTQIGLSKYNTNASSPADAGYMYGTRYTYLSRKSSNLSTSYVYGRDISYSGGTYTLTNTMTSSGTWSNDYNTLNNNHYTCFSTENSCTSVYYIYYTDPSQGALFIKLENGDKVEDALDEMFTNTTNSNAKTTIDNWYNSNLTSYASFIEDTIYCNDRSISELNGWNPNGGDTTKGLYYNPRIRTFINYTPSLECSRAQDRFTVSSSKGNGALTYPVGLITIDEVIYAGGRRGKSNGTYYLYNRQYYWTNSLNCFLTWRAGEFTVNKEGGIADDFVNDSTIGIRPIISLKSKDAVESGDGTSANPYVIDVINRYYSIYTDENIKTKDISFNVNDTSFVKSGEMVTFKITPIDGYAIGNIEILDDDDNEILYNSTSNENEYSFVMPDTDVTIKPLYRKLDTSNNTIVNPKTGITIIGLLIVFVMGMYIYYVLRKKYKNISLEN